MRFQGRIKNWNDDKGFGFIEPNGGGNRSFVHIKSFHKPSRRPVEGDIIVYEQVKDAKGKFKALNIRFARERRLRSTTPRRDPIRQEAELPVEWANSDAARPVAPPREGVRPGAGLKV